MKWRILFVLTTLMLSAKLFAADNQKVSSGEILPPPPAREFRGVWLVTVANIDWPSKPGLPVAQQKAELISLLDRAAQLKFNAVLFQVRSVCDAFYASPIEPWSEYLTGTQGRAPEPFYDPLALAIAEAHKRGLELHAWFNPFRASHPLARSPAALNHITRTHPELIRHYGKQIWLDPGEPAVQARVVAVVQDVVKRYDVDGIIFDDYFYPYREKNWAGRELDFPDDASWKKFGAASGFNREDWRRENVNHFIRRVSQAIKSAKPWVQFGISPFGIWRPQNPAQIKGMDAYAKIYADSRKWLANGWVDYFAPQLYWPVAPREQSFPVLFDWWRAQNSQGRHLWPALADSSVGTKFSTEEIPHQVQITRGKSDPGAVHFHLRSVLDNPALAAAVRAQYAPPALVPRSPWIAAPPPLKPKLMVDTGKNSVRIRWENSGGEMPRGWVLQSRTNGIWTTEIFPPGRADAYRDHFSPDAVSIRAVGRLGVLSEPAIWTPKKYSTPDTTRGATRMKN
ncbi:MAG TPA: hypothetical protein DCQ92_18915 [Verrucomicrobia subdivision 3 bacterium]|nr:hypothetical protein [Limisphaerales bacterium]